MTYLSEVLADTPSGYWRMDDAPGASVMADSSGNARNGTFTGSPTLGAASLLVAGGGTACAFTGANRASVPDNSVFDLSASGFTIELWVKVTTPTANTAQVIIDKANGSGTNSSYSIFVDNRSAQGTPKRLRCILGSGNVDWTGDTAMAALAAGGHLAIKYATGQLWWNGVMVASSAVAGGGNNALNVTIGALAAGTLPLTGTVDEVALYNYLVPDARLQAHYQAGIGLGGKFSGWGIAI